MTTVYETNNSLYEIDTDNMRYRRGPNASTAYQAPEVRNWQESHRLVDGVWIPMKSAEVIQMGDYQILHIMAEDSVGGVLTSPIVRVAVDIEVPE